MKVCVIIPTYNEAKAIAGIIKEIRSQSLEVVIIDDGSLDNTSLIAAQNGAVVLKNERNQGKGASLLKGFSYALNHGFDAVITMDGDGQHDPTDIQAFIKTAQSSDNSVFIGNRMSKTGKMPFIRILTNIFMSWLLSLATKQRIPDTQCGFRLIKKGVLKAIKLTTTKYETESEVLVKSAKSGFKIESVPIKTIYAGEKSQINPFIDTIRFFNFIIRELWTTGP